METRRKKSGGYSEEVCRANVSTADKSGELSGLLDFLSRYGIIDDRRYRS
jgi:hypothetical protein